jgi:hypothetical protein
MHDLLKTKAEAADIIKLHDIKTNKEDTEQNMLNIETIHRMLKNLSSMQTEAFKWILEDFKKINKGSHENTIQFLHTQSIKVDTWIN